MFKGFQVKTISKDVAAPAIYWKILYVFLWILRTLRTPFYIEHLRSLLLIIQFSSLNQWNNKYIDMIFLQDLCVLQKVKEYCCFRHVICCTPKLSWSNKVCFFCACLQCFRDVQRCMGAITWLICWSLLFDEFALDKVTFLSCSLHMHRFIVWELYRYYFLVLLVWHLSSPNSILLLRSHFLFSAFSLLQ